MKKVLIGVAVGTRRGAGVVLHRRADGGGHADEHRREHTDSGGLARRLGVAPSHFHCRLHADELLWGRDLLSRVERGHVDLPRLQEGKVALQVFSVVTKTPRDMNYDKNTGETDNIALLSLAQRWPAATRTSLRARAVYQAEKLQDAVLRAGGAITLITTRDTLMAFARRRGGDPMQVARCLPLKGCMSLDGQLESVGRALQ